MNSCSVPSTFWLSPSLAHAGQGRTEIQHGLPRRHPVQPQLSQGILGWILDVEILTRGVAFEVDAILG